VVTLKDGCVETLVNWEEVLEIALLGVEPSQIPQEIIQVTDTSIPI
jgi:hypothetical protein